MEAAKAAMDRRDWPEAARLCVSLRATLPDKPHGYVWGAKAAQAAGDPGGAEALFRESLRLFPADPWPEEDWLSWLQAQRRWQEADTEATSVMQRVDPAGRLYRAAFVAKFRAVKVLNETAISDDSIRTAIEHFGANETIMREVIDLCVSRKDVDFALRWWTELRDSTTVSRELLADAVKRLYPVYCLQPGAELFVSWLFVTNGRSPLAFPVISTVRYLMNSTDVPRHVRGLLQQIYDSHEPAGLDNLIRAAIGPFFGDVLDEHLYLAVMIEFLPKVARMPLARNPLNNVFFFASHGQEEFPSLETAATRIRAAFAAAVRYFLGGNLRLPEHDREIYQLVLIADLIATEIYETVFAFVKSHVSALAGCDTGTAAGVLRLIVAERALAGAPSIGRGKPKICVELAANLRGYRRAFQTWHHLGLEGYETVYVAHLWNRIGRRLPWATHAAKRAFEGHFLEAYVQVMAENGWDYIQRQYPNVIGLITQSDTLDVEDIERVYHPIALQIEDSDAPEFKQKPPHYKMYYSWYQSHQLALQAAPDADIYIRIRPDLYFERPLDLDWTDFAARADAENIIYTQFPRKYLPTGGPIGVGDQIAIGGRRGIGVYCNTFKDTLAAFEGKLYGYPLKWAGHDNVSFSTFYHSVRALAHPNLPPNNPMYDPPPLAARLIHDRIVQDMAQRAVTRVDESLLSALERDLS